MFKGKRQAMIHKTVQKKKKGLSTTNPTKIGDEFKSSARITVAGSTSGTFRVTLFTIPWIGHE
jgi:hypothetical protein